MPVRWSAELDQILLLKLLETHEITLRPNLICSAWPKDKGEAPTERAIREHLFKLRKDHGIKGKFAKGSLPSTPVKKEPISSLTTPSASTGTKRKRNDDISAITPSSMASSSGDEHESSSADPVKNEPRDEVIELLSDDETPSKRVRRSFAPAPGSFSGWPSSSTDRPYTADQEDHRFDPPTPSPAGFVADFDDEYA